MPFLSNAHTHSTFCDGKNTLEEMIAAARAHGFVSLGFSGHAAQGFDFSYSMSPEHQQAYFDAVHTLQKTETGLRIWAGLELDALAGEAEKAAARQQADYLLGSTHYLCTGDTDTCVAVDGWPDRLKAYTDAVFVGDGLAMARRYFEIETDFLLSMKPDVIGHFDLVRIHAGKLGLFDESTPAYRKIALNALERAFACGGVLEVNTGGMARGYLPTPYPTFELLCAWREMGGRVTITSDCHYAHLLTHWFDEAMQMLAKAGYNQVMHLGCGDVLWDSFEL